MNPPRSVHRVLGYGRVSTDEQGDNGAGLAAQRKAIRAEAKARGWELVETVEDVASGKSMNRPGIQSALAKLAAGEADALICAKLDRLGRDVGDFADLLKRSQREGWALRLLDLDIDTSSSAGEAMANVLVTFAQFERRRIGERTREGLAVKRAEGVQLGRPRQLPAKVVTRIRNLRSRGHSLAKIAERLNADNVPTAHGGAKWHPSTVRAVLNRAAR